jgi:hypothetical protein
MRHSAAKERAAGFAPGVWLPTVFGCPGCWAAQHASFPTRAMSEDGQSGTASACPGAPSWGGRKSGAAACDQRDLSDLSTCPLARRPTSTAAYCCNDSDDCASATMCSFALSRKPCCEGWNRRSTVEEEATWCARVLSPELMHSVWLDPTECVVGPKKVCGWTQQNVWLDPRKCVVGPKKVCGWTQERGNKKLVISRT